MLRLLIADDEPIVRQALGELIDWKNHGIQLTACCKNGLEALDAIVDTAPDLVMTDIMMPGIDGLELIRRIREVDDQIQFIILSGHREFEFAKKAMEYGVQHYLLKPINDQQILEAVMGVQKQLAAAREPDLATRLLAIKATGTPPLAAKALRTHFEALEDIDLVRKSTIDLLIGLRTGLDSIDSPTLAALIERLYTLPTMAEATEAITTETLALLFPEEAEALSISDSIKRAVAERLAEPDLSLKWIAENRLYMNVDYLSRTFAAQTGERFSAYLNRTRIENAKTLLPRYGTGKIYEVAQQVGFGNNPQYFSQIFKKYTGLTPRQYIESL